MEEQIKILQSALAASERMRMSDAGSATREAYSLRGRIKDLTDELTRANARIEELSKALQDLCDLQNGPPLPTYTKDWNETMERCYKLLEK